MYSPSAAAGGLFPNFGPRIVDISVVARPYPASSGSIYPGSIFLEDSESVSTTFFCCSCMDYSFRNFLLSCPCVGLTSTFLSTFFFLYGTCVYVYTTRWHIPTRGIVLLHFTSCPTSDDVTATLMGVRDWLTHHQYHRRHRTHSSSCTCSAVVFETWFYSLLTVPTFSWRWT